MKNIIKLEALGLMILFSCTYFYLYPSNWGFYLALFFVPDVAFALYLINKKWAVFAYNILHHQGFLAMVLLIGFYLKEDLLIKLGFIFLAHSTFDRIAGYGLKFFDSFDHTHLGWVGKSKHLNK